MGDYKIPAGEDICLERLLASKKVVRHLLRGCETCQTVFQSLISIEAPAQGEAEASELSLAYDAALDLAMNDLGRAATLPRGEQWRFRKATSLLRSGGGVLAIAKTGKMSVEGLGVYEALLTRSWAIRFDNPREMCHLAKVAMEMAEGVKPENHNAKIVADMRARAWGELANAYRVVDRLCEAQDAFGKAFGYLHEGSGDRSLKMRLLDLEASYLGTSREFSLAQERLTTLAAMHRSDGDDHLVGRTLVTKALYTFYRGDAQEACETIAEGLALIDRERDPSLVLVAAFDYLLFLVDCNRLKDAKRALFENRTRFVTQGNVASLKLRWVEGRISYGLQELESAEIAFREAKEGLAGAGMGLAAGIAGLDLAMTLLRQGRREEAVQEGLESAAMFRALGVHREILGTVVLLEETFKTQSTDLALLEASASYLRRKWVELGLE